MATNDDATRANAKERGRYGEAPRDRPHLSPEIEPLGMGDAEIPQEKTENVAGDLPENRARDSDKKAESPKRHE